MKGIGKMKKDYGYPSYDLICRASNGDEKAVRGILELLRRLYL